MSKKKIGVLAVLAMTSGMAIGQLQVSTNLTPVQLVEDVLVGSCVQISNVRFNGTLTPATAQAGTGAFSNGGNTNLGLGNGVILSTGPVNQVPNNAGFNQSSALTPNYTNDPDLVAVTGGAINNAVVLEFDFVPNGDSISFRYVFASEEYPEFVCAYNDAFGFFLSGPGITGPYTNNARNIALVPGSTTPVSINNVNNGLNNLPTNPTCPSTNPQYYINNASGTTIVYDGFTAVLTARAAVQCNQTYHIKLAICDALDQIFDSGVFLEAGSFSSVPYVPDLSPGPSIVGNVIYESCLPLSMDIQRTSCDLTTTETVYLSYGGTAQMGVDLTPPFPDSLVFGPGQGSIAIPFFAPLDGDGQESFIINLAAVDCNGLQATSTFQFIIDERPPLVVAGSTNTISCGQEVTLGTTASGGFGQYQYSWNTGDTTSTITVSPLVATTYTLTVVDLCDATTSATYQVNLAPPPPLNMSILGDSTLLEGCVTGRFNVIRPQGSAGEISITISNGGSATVGDDHSLPGSVVIADDLLNVIVDVPTFPDDLVEGDETVIITGSYTNACNQTVTASVEFVIEDVEPFRVAVNDVRAECGPDSMLVLVTVTGGVAPFAYDWSTGEESIGILVPLLTDGQVSVVVIDACGREASATSRIIIDCDVIIPNVFSPNSDGVNDVWEIDGLQNRESTVRVYNRWGQVVLDVKNYRNDWSASDVPDGTYYYEVIVVGKGDPLTGHVTVLRNRW